MNEKRFSIFSSWDPRPETPTGLGRRMLETLDSLSQISPHFKNWWFMNYSSVPSVDIVEDMDDDEEFPSPEMRPLETMRGNMAEMVELGVRRGDRDEPEPNGGYTTCAFSSIEYSPYQVVMTAHGGGIVDPRVGYRMAEFNTAADPDPAIIAYPLFKEVLKSIVAAWDVRHAQAYPDALREFWNEPSKLFLDLAWMTYLSPELAEDVIPPKGILVEQTDDGGLFMIAAEETFDTENPEHMAAAWSILRALDGINAAHEEKCERLWPGP